LISCFGSFERLGVQIMPFQISANGRFQFTNTAMRPSADFSPGQGREATLYQIEIGNALNAIACGAGLGRYIQP
jgi:hypothetical protein